MARSKRRATPSTPAASQPAGGSASADRARDNFLNAVRHFNVGDLNGATRLLNTILETRPSEPDALHLLGVISAQRGALEDGAKLIARSLSIRPSDISARNSLAGLLLTLGRPAEAAEVIAPALTNGAPSAGLYYNYANAQRQLGAHQAAIDAYRTALRLKPDFVDAALNLTLTLLESGDIAAAEQTIRTAIERAPQAATLKLSLGCVLLAANRAEEALAPLDQAASAGLVDARHRLGRAYLSLGRLEEAKRTLERAVVDAPAIAAIRTDLGIVLLALDANTDAVRRFREAIARAPNSAEPYTNLTEALRRTGALTEAIGHGQRATQLSPLSATAWLNLGAVLLDAAQPQDALDALARAVMLAPNSAEAENSYGSAQEATGDIAAALAAYDRALAHKPDLHEARFNRALARLRLGDYRNGFADYEARRRLKGVTKISSPAPEWQGETFAGRTLLLYSEQGMGDTLQFARFATRAAANGGAVILACQEPLVRLLQGLDRTAAVVSINGPLPPHDLIAPLLSVPYRLGTDLANLPNVVPYIVPPTAMALAHDGPAFKIGIAWAGAPGNRINYRRSCPIDAFAPLAGLDGIALHGLQVGPEAAQLERVDFGARVKNLGPRFTDFHDTASAMMALDLVITIDTSVAHLAGALGREVWVILSAGGDWRYFDGRADNPWYPTMRLFRQPAPGDWASVIDAVGQALAARRRA